MPLCLDSASAGQYMLKHAERTQPSPTCPAVTWIALSNSSIALAGEVGHIPCVCSQGKGAGSPCLPCMLLGPLASLPALSTTPTSDIVLPFH